VHVVASLGAPTLTRHYSFGAGWGSDTPGTGPAGGQGGKQSPHVKAETLLAFRRSIEAIICPLFTGRHAMQVTCLSYRKDARLSVRHTLRYHNDAC